MAGRIQVLLAGLTVLVIGATACGTQPSQQDPPADEAFTALIVTAKEGEVHLDDVQVLSGEQAAAAREEDGEPAVEEGVDLPYVRNTGSTARTYPVASDVTVEVYDCSESCTLVTWDYEDLMADTPLPYGGPDTPFEVILRDGAVVALTEVYLA